MSSSYSISSIAVSSLRPHENVDLEHLEKLYAQIVRDGGINTPILVDGATGTVLDGHHRVMIASRMGLDKITAYIVDYLDDGTVALDSWRAGLELTKADVIQAALSRQLLPPRSSRHYFNKGFNKAA